MRYLPPLTTPKAIIATLICLGLSGCLGTASSPDELAPLPPSAQIAGLAEAAYVQAKGQRPTDLTVTKVGTAEIIAPGAFDYYACVATRETEPHTTFFADGSVARRAGAPYSESFIMLFRNTNGSWGVGIFRPVRTTTEIGFTKAAAFCPTRSN